MPEQPDTIANDLRITDVAAIKQVHPSTVRRWIANGSLPAYRIGPKAVRIKPADLDALGRRIPSAGGAG